LLAPSKKPIKYALQKLMLPSCDFLALSSAVHRLSKSILDKALPREVAFELNANSGNSIDNIAAFILAL
jgi:hypothetical protein